MREIITLECTTCKNRTYSTTKNKRKTTDRLVLNKYCKYDRKHTEHKEAK
ncbi:MAG TPA: 50S ribosomal protein L33 [Candidatus Wallbacteria bacterium]|nr:MAG: 50S ribosomal protein L33 [bacterium ADurb.Bin243]HOD39469.1 50S ribosomal protein L33 [Candidatus Wallbacteria bacterium]HOT77493.1 50S ribosomal protein L33 [Candidatus Wallbacteria bacterium]